MYISRQINNEFRRNPEVANVLKLHYICFILKTIVLGLYRGTISKETSDERRNFVNGMIIFTSVLNLLTIRMYFSYLQRKEIIYKLQAILFNLFNTILQMLNAKHYYDEHFALWKMFLPIGEGIITAFETVYGLKKVQIQKTDPSFNGLLQLSADYKLKCKCLYRYLF